LPVKTTVLDIRKFRCVAYDWEVSISRRIIYPPDLPNIQTPKEAWEYYTRIKRTYTVSDGNAAGNEDFYPTFEQAWHEYCKIVGNYARAFMQVGKNGQARLDLPDPLRIEPVH